MATGGGSPATNPDPTKQPAASNGQNKTSISLADVYVALLGLVLIGLLALLVIWFYGTAGETSAAGVLGLAFTAVGSIVGTVFGVSAGTKSGTAGGIAGGQQVAQATTQRATNAMKSTIQSIQNMKVGAEQAHKTLTHHLKAMATGATPPPPPDLQPLQEQIHDALLKAQQALEDISGGP